MATRISYSEKKQKVVVDLINEMFKIAGHPVTYDDVVTRTDAWYSEYSMTEEQQDQWIKWGEEYIVKKLKFTKRSARNEMGWVALNWGLTTKINK